MNQMSGLVYNEAEKILRQWRFVIVLILYTLFALSFAFSVNRVTDAHYTAASAASLWVMGGFAGILIPFALCVLVGDSLAGEYSAGTMKLLLVRPVSRRTIWISKYIAAVCAGLATVLYLGLCTYVSLGFALGWGSWAARPPAELNSGLTTVWALTWRAYALEALAVTALTSFIFLVSSLARNGIAAVGACLGAILVGFMVTNIGRDSAWLALLLSPHLQVADHLIRSFPAPGCSLAESVLALFLWACLCGAASVWVFQRRDVTE